LNAVHADTTQLVYAGFWRRFAANLVDGLVIVPMMLLPMALIFFVPKGLWLVLVLMYVLNIVLPWIYMATMESSAWQASLGKRALGIKVTGLEGQRVSFGRATGRYFAKWLSAIILNIGYILAGFTERKQALHDFVAETLVVRAGASTEEVRSGKGTMPVTAGVWITIGLYLLVIVCGIGAAITIPAYQKYMARARQVESARARAKEDEGARAKVMEVIAEARAIEPAVAAELWHGGPEREIPPKSPYVKRVIVRPSDRTLVMVVDWTTAGYPLAEGGSIRFHLEADGSWTCTNNGVRDEWLPPACRR
jgi:uncharacterized RDD family membrane protein YckC